MSSRRSTAEGAESSARPYRQVRAAYTDATITVYQAYSSEIAVPAIRSGRFVAPFKRDRMTWIKPSFLWMAYRSGWASKPGQEHVLEIQIDRAGFEWAMANASLSHFEAAVHESVAAWEEQRDGSPVRVQWDPERDLLHRPLDHRSIQVGLSGAALALYVDEWVFGIDDITETFRSVGELVRTGDLAGAAGMLPDERPYPLPHAIAERLGAG